MHAARSRLSWVCPIYVVFTSAGCEAPVQYTELAIRLSEAAGCELADAQHLQVSALGDFPAEHAALSSDEGASLEDFPLATRELAVDGTFGRVHAAGRIDASSARTERGAELWVMPDQRSCPLADSAAKATDGAAVVALARGALLVAGGTDAEGRAVTSAVVLRSGRDLLELVPDDGLLLRRSHASATAVGEWVVVAGGATGSAGEGHDSFEVYDDTRGVFAREQSGRLGAPRLEHAAAALPDGRLLVAGGRAEVGGEALASAELIALTGEPRPEPVTLALATARIAPELLALDSGVHVLVGGVATSGETVRSIERFDLERERFVPFEVELPDHAHAVAAALPGDRVAWFGCGPLEAPSCALSLALVRGERASVHPLELDFASALPRGLLEPRMLAQEDGRLLITGRDPEAAISARALVVDPSARSVVAVDASRTPTRLAALTDGVIVELDRVGGSVRRSGSASEYQSPEGELLTDEALPPALDHPDRWRRSDEGLEALVEDARLDVPRLRFADFTVSVVARGRWRAIVAATGAPELRLSFGSGQPPASGCALGAETEATDASIRLERRGATVTLIDGAGARCALTWPATGRARLAIEAGQGALLQSLRVSRSGP